MLKALGILRQDGWIDSQQGKGHFVRGRPKHGRTSPEYARDALDVDESADVELLHVGPVLASSRVATALQIPDGTPVYERRRRTTAGGVPVDLVATFVPIEIAAGTAVTKPEPIAEGLLEHIGRLKQLRGDYATERMTARAASDDEAEALGVPAGEPVLAVAITLHQANGEPLLTTHVVMPGSRHEIEDTYPMH